MADKSDKTEIPITISFEEQLTRRYTKEAWVSCEDVLAYFKKHEGGKLYGTVVDASNWSDPDVIEEYAKGYAFEDDTTLCKELSATEMNEFSLEEDLESQDVVGVEIEEDEGNA